TTLNARDQPPAEVSDQRVSGLTGAVHPSSNKSFSTAPPRVTPNDTRTPVTTAPPTQRPPQLTGSCPDRGC
ncbi:hypothetical protein FHI80_16570, partial [Mycobacterium orygis]